MIPFSGYVAVIIMRQQVATSHAKPIIQVQKMPAVSIQSLLDNGMDIGI